LNSRKHAGRQSIKNAARRTQPHRSNQGSIDDNPFIAIGPVDRMVFWNRKTSRKKQDDSAARQDRKMLSSHYRVDKKSTYAECINNPVCKDGVGSREAPFSKGRIHISGRESACSGFGAKDSTRGAREKSSLPQSKYRSSHKNDLDDMRESSRNATSSGSRDHSSSEIQRKSLSKRWEQTKTPRVKSHFSERKRRDILHKESSGMKASSIIRSNTNCKIAAKSPTRVVDTIPIEPRENDAQMTTHGTYSQVLGSQDDTAPSFVKVNTMLRASLLESESFDYMTEIVYSLSSKSDRHRQQQSSFGEIKRANTRKARGRSVARIKTRKARVRSVVELDGNDWIVDNELRGETGRKAVAIREEDGCVGQYNSFFNAILGCRQTEEWEVSSRESESDNASLENENFQKVFQEEVREPENAEFLENGRDEGATDDWSQDLSLVMQHATPGQASSLHQFVQSVLRCS
jgi:hypothetical protein